MVFSFFDWSIIVLLLALMAVYAIKSKRYTSSVADFLAANRCAGRYMLGVSQGIAYLGAISIIAMFEGYYASGFTFVWWGLLQLVVVKNIVTLSGWVQYRFRETRALTMAQFLEQRYSKNFRVAAGLTAFISGVLNFALFPAIGARFFKYFCGLPTYEISVGFATIDLTYATIMALLLIISLYFTFAGGQISVMVTDFIQGTFSNIVLLIVIAFLFYKVPWSFIMEALSQRPPGESMLNPFDTSDTKTFNMWYYIIAAFGMFWCHLSWLGGQGYLTSARNAHEARMGQAFGGWREYTQMLLVVILAVCAYTVMHHPYYAEVASTADSALNQVSTDADDVIRKQITTPVALRAILPIGLLGGFAAVMLAAFISTHDSYLHGWGSIFIQDVVLPFRKKPLPAKQHLRLLKYSIFGVAVFIFLFSLFFKQSDTILLFFALTGTLFLGGAGTCVVGGLYWKRGTTAGAFGALSVGWILFIFGIAVEYLWPKYNNGDKFPVNAQWRFFIAMIASILIYTVLSLITGRKTHNMDKLLHRGKYAIESDAAVLTEKSVSRWLRVLGVNREFTMLDKIIYMFIAFWSLLWAVIFFAGLLYQKVVGVSLEDWGQFWHVYVWMALVIGIVTTVWFTIGGVIDMQKMFKRLSTLERDDFDDGKVLSETSDDETDTKNIKE